MYSRILVPLDGSSLAECVLPHVQAISTGCNVPSVEIVRVVEPLQLPTRGGIALSDDDLRRARKEMREEAQRYLQRIAGELSARGIKTDWKVLEGKPAEQIVERARETGADLLIMASHGASGISRWVWGSVTDRILRASSLPVLLIRAPGCIPGRQE